MRAYQLQTISRVLAVILFACQSNLAFAEGTDRFAQMVLTLADKRPYQYEYNEKERALVLTLQNTAPQELAAVEHYDERLIRRVVLRDLGQGAGTELKLVLKDEDVRVTIADFDEPFRIVIDLYDRHFQEVRDKNSGLPQLGASDSEKSSLRGGIHDDEKPRFVRDLSDDEKNEGSGSTDASTAAESAQPRRLLQPMPAMLANAEDLNAALDQVAGGPGKSWPEYPVYVYRIQTAPYKTGKEYSQWIQQNSVKAMTSAESMAEYASKLFDYGHEGRALFAYQQVLHKAPGVFASNPIHLWKLAEIHLGQGNLLLADGYYQSEIDKHPDSPLSKFAAMRRLDIKAIKAGREGRPEEWSSLAAQLDTIKSRENPELIAQMAIRRAYWQSKDSAQLKILAEDRHALPSLDGPNKTTLEQSYKKAENQWTIFLGATLLLNQNLDQTGRWDNTTSALAGDYFEQYKGPKVEPYRSQLQDKIGKTLVKTIQELVLAGKHLDAVNVHESLPASLKDDGLNPDTAWYLGEAFRHIGQPGRAVLFYHVAARESKEGPDRFKAQFWYGVTAGQALELVRGNPSQANTLRQAMQSADQDMWKSWEGLPQAEREKIFTSMKPDLEAAAKGKGFLKSPPRIVLSAWDQALGTEITATANTTPSELQKYYSPSLQTIHLISDLGRRFGELGMKNERARSLKLLMRLKPAQLDGGVTAVNLWAKELTGLAEEFRQENNYLDSGRIYALIGMEADNWEGRAESLYKGGLLLYRAGRRAEAIEAFKKASEDPNNLMYADLAKTRLSQLQP